MFRKLIALFLLFIFVVVSVPFFFATGFVSVYTDENFYNDKFVDVIHNFVQVNVPKYVDIKQYKFLTETDKRDILNKIVDKSDLRDIRDDLIEEVKTAKVDENGGLNITVSLKTLADKSEEIASQITDILYKRLPTCETNVEEFDLSNINCIPKKISRLDIEMNIKRSLDNGIFAQLPGSYNLVSIKNIPPTISGNVTDLFSDGFKLVILIVGLFLVLLLALIGLLIFRPFVSVIKWIANAISTSTILLVFLQMFLLLVSTVFRIFVQKYASQISTAEVESFKNIFDLLLGSVANAILIYAVPVAVISLVIWIISASKEKRVLNN